MNKILFKLRTLNLEIELMTVRDPCYVTQRDHRTVLMVLKEKFCFATVNTGDHNLFFLPPGVAAIE